MSEYAKARGFEQKVNESGCDLLLPDEINVSVNPHHLGAYLRFDPAVLTKVLDGINNPEKYDVSHKKPIGATNFGTPENPDWRATWFRTVNGVEPGQPGYISVNQYQDKDGNTVGKGDRMQLVMRIGKEQRQNIDKEALTKQITADILAQLAAAGIVTPESMASLSETVAATAAAGVAEANTDKPVSAEPSVDDALAQAQAAADALAAG